MLVKIFASYFLNSDIPLHILFFFSDLPPSLLLYTIRKTHTSSGEQITYFVNCTQPSRIFMADVRILWGPVYEIPSNI